MNVDKKIINISNHVQQHILKITTQKPIRFIIEMVKMI